MSLRASTDEIIRAVAGFGLPGSTLALPAELDGEGWDAVRRVAVDQRLPGLLLHALLAGNLGPTEARLELARADHVASMGLALELERHLLAVADLFAAAGIDWRVLKGPALAHLDYPDPSLRSFGDVDILVREAHYDRACEALSDAGGHRRYAQPRPGFDRRFGKGVCFFMPAGYELDLHRSFVAGPFGLRVRQDDLFAEAGEIMLAGHRIPTLSREARFLNACYHAVLGARPPRMVPLRDLAQLMLSGLDRDRVEALTSTWKIEGLVARAVNVTWETFGLADALPLSEWARSYRPTKVERRQLAAYVSSRRSYASQAAAALSALPRLSDKVAYMRAIAFPTREYVAARDGGYRRRLRRGIRVAAAVGDSDE